MERRVVEQDPFNASTPVAALASDVTPRGLHYVRNHFPIPAGRDAQRWRLAVGGAVARPLTLDLAALAALGEKRTLTVTLECAGNSRIRWTPAPPGTPWDDGAVSTARWSGVPLAAVLAAASPRGDAVEVLARGADRGTAGGREMAFERSLPIADALAGDALVAWEMNGEPLAAEHGAPLRLVVPRWYGVASVKWLVALELITRPFEGYYQRERYTYAGWRDARPVTNARVKSALVPPQAARIGQPVMLLGRAWSGDGEIVRVELSTDGGQTWNDATLDAPPGPFAWRGFRARWTPARAGAHTLLARATDAKGNTQPLALAANTHGYGYNACVPVTVEVAR
ncbi:MAG: sulfite oxidase [Thermoplasmatota archaeon]